MINQGCSWPKRTQYENLVLLGDETVMFTCPAAEMGDGSKVLYFEQRLYMVKPCSKEMKCDVEDVAEHLTTIYLKRCPRGKRCLYEGSTPPAGFPNSWNGASYCTSELSVVKKDEINMWDRGYDDNGNQVWGVKNGPYEFKPAPPSRSSNDMLSPLHIAPLEFLEKRVEGSFALQD
ncbi:hypothetical protein ACHQM5_021713 [Ranunculus cassubicifolius]